MAQVTTGGRAGIFGQRFVLFADCLYLGVLVFLASLPVVTAFAAVTAGVGVLRDRVRDDSTFTIGGYLRRLRIVITDQWLVLLGPPLLVVLYLINVVALAAGLPGAELYRPTLLVVAVGAVVVGLRAAMAWHPGTPWSAALRTGAADAIGDPGGSALLLGGLVASGVIIGQTWLMLPLVTGLMLFAVVAVTMRERT